MRKCLAVVWLFFSVPKLLTLRVSSYFLYVPHLIVTPIRFNIFDKYSTQVYQDFNISKYVPAISSQSERELQ